MFCRGLVVSPLPCEFSVPGFPCPLFTSLPLSDLAGQHSCCTNPFHCVILRASLGHLLPLCLFYFYEFFTKSFGLPRPNYHIFTFQYYLGLLVFRPAHWVYYSFPGLSWLIYSLSTSYYSYELTTSFIKLSRPTYYLFISFHYCGHAGHQFYHSSLLGLALLLSLLTFFILLDFFYCWALCQKWTSTFIFL